MKLLLSIPMRLFFTGASLTAILALLVTGYLKTHADTYDLNTDYILYHMHELSFGFFGAGIIGFLFTAIPNWTGQKPIQGLPIFTIGLLWLLARVLWIVQSDVIHPALLLLDLVPFAILIGYLLYAIIITKYVRGLIILSALFGYYACYVASNYHIYIGNIDMAYAFSEFSLFVVVVLVSIIGGRITPNFTRGYLKSINPNIIIKDKFFLLPIIIIGILSTGWAISFTGGIDKITATIATISAVATIIRMSGWQSFKTVKNPLLFMIHVSYFFFVISFSLTALAGFTDIIETATVIHAFSIGVCASILIAIMIRASKGHNGLPLFANKFDIMAYAFVLLAMLGRLSADYLDNPIIGYHITKTFWILAFTLFLIRFIPVFLKPKK